MDVMAFDRLEKDLHSSKNGERHVLDSSPHRNSVPAAEFRQRLENHPHFRGRSRWIQARSRGGVLRLGGCLPSFYLKQLVQTIARTVPNIQRVVNRIAVQDACGVSLPPGVIRETGRSRRRPS